MSRVRVRIDLNAFDADGLTRTKLKNASGPLEAGRMVVAYEPEDESMFQALVDHIDESTGYAFLQVNWESMQDDISEHSLALAFERPTELAAATSKVPTFSWSEIFQVKLPLLEQGAPHFARSITA
jgi:hypothetical protein